MLDFDSVVRILVLIVGLIAGSFGMSALIDWLFSFHEPEDEWTQY